MVRMNWAIHMDTRGPSLRVRARRIIYMGSAQTRKELRPLTQRDRFAIAIAPIECFTTGDGSDLLLRGVSKNQRI